MRAAVKKSKFTNWRNNKRFKKIEYLRFIVQPEKLEP